MPARYSPPFTLSTRTLDLVARISEELGRLGIKAASAMPPRLRRSNRLRTIQASLEIENNTLTLDQVTAAIAGKRVLGPPKEIQEVRNAFEAYDAMSEWAPSSEKALLAAHRILMKGVMDHPGRYRTGGVGIAQGEKLVHL